MSMRRRDLLMLSPLVVLGLPAARAAGQIAPFTLVCPEFPPYSVEKGPQAPGLLIELLQLLGLELGLELQPQYYPFARASLLAQRGPRTAIAPLARTPEREGQYRWLLPLFTQRYVLLARAERWLALQALPSLRELRVAALRGSVSPPRLRALQYLNVSEEGSYEHLLRRLDEGSADLIYGSQPLFIGALRSSGRALRDYQLGPVLDELGVWLGGSPDFEEADAQALRAAMERLRRSGAYTRFLQKADLTPDILGIR
jgi:polar amino acid transport system substrate-binding protein